MPVSWWKSIHFGKHKSEPATTMETPLWVEECVNGVWLAQKHQRGFSTRDHQLGKGKMKEKTLKRCRMQKLSTGF